MKQINNGLHTGTVLQVLVPIKQRPPYWYSVSSAWSEIKAGSTKISRIRNTGTIQATTERAQKMYCTLPVCRVNWLIYVQIVQISSAVVFVNLQGRVAHPRDQLFTSATNKNLVLKSGPVDTVWIVLFLNLFFILIEECTHYQYRSFKVAW
jgi:hypothetical protein